MSTTLDTTPIQCPQTGNGPAVIPARDAGADTYPTVTVEEVEGVADDESTDVIITFDSDELPCRQHDADLWFAEKPADLETAKSHCRECPLRAECLEGALERAEPWGVWGGEIFDRGVVIARKRPRGRPRKHDISTPVAA
jgi:WhiB family transcriptional regulator, redox-sensing transcriptional regulator